MDEVVPLITVEDGKYEVHRPTLQWLEERKAPFTVMSCAGPFRGGKSFLLNRFLEQPAGKGFGVGDTVQACTRGIWLCKKFVKEEGTDVLVLDSEGIGALDVSDDHDVRIFVLAVLLSTAFVYNGTSHLDEGAIQTLSLMTRVADALSDGESKPSLYWVLRDFSLQLVDETGRKISHADYLENALNTGVGSKCEVRDAIKRAFPTRYLVTLPRPQKGDSAHRLEYKAVSALNSKFVSFLTTFRKHVCQNSRPVTAAGVPMTGSMYAAFVTDVVKRINESTSIPKMEDSWCLLAKIQHKEKEIELRTDLLARAERECPQGPEDVVVGWVLAAVEEVCTSAVFMAPAPDKTALATTLADEVLFFCKTAGKVQDVEALAKRLVQEARTTLETNEYVDPGCFAVDRVSPNMRGEFASQSLALICDELWEKGMQASATRTRDKVLEEVSLERENIVNELESTRAILLDVKTAEEKLRKDMEWFPEREDASTQTDFPDDVDDWSSPRCETREGTEKGDETTDGDEVLLVHLRTELETSQAKERELEIQLKNALEREGSTRQTFEEGLEGLRKQSLSQLEDLRSECAQAKRETAEVLEQKHAVLEQKHAIEGESEKLRTLVRDAQEKSVESHRNLLEELRRRDSETRKITDDMHKQQMETRVKYETTSMEVKSLKRRMDELLQENEKVKRLRTILSSMESERVGRDAELTLLKAQLSQLREDKDAASAQNLALENKVAVLNAMSQLDAARKSFGS
jgi:hypothetical protein